MDKQFALLGKMSINNYFKNPATVLHIMGFDNLRMLNHHFSGFTIQTMPWPIPL